MNQLNAEEQQVLAKELTDIIAMISEQDTRKVVFEPNKEQIQAKRLKELKNEKSAIMRKICKRIHEEEDDAMPEQGVWSCSETQITIPAITEDPESAKGKAAHEAAHAVITKIDWDYIEELENKSFGFKHVFAATEERPTDNWVYTHFEGAAYWLKKARRESLKEYFKKPKNTKALLGAQACHLIVYAEHIDFETMEYYYDPRVVETYKAIREDIIEIEKLLPQRFANKEIQQDIAALRIEKMYKDIYPNIKPLFEKDIQGESQKSKKAKKGSSVQINEIHTIPRKVNIQRQLDKISEQFKPKLVKKEESEKEKEEDSFFSHQNKETKKKRTSNKELREQQDENYHHLYEQTIEHMNDLVAQLQKHLLPNYKGGMSLHNSGTKINIGAAFQREVQKQAGSAIIREDIFERRYKRSHKDYAISITLDLSISMLPDAMDEETAAIMSLFNLDEAPFYEAQKGLILMAESLERVNIPFEIRGFNKESFNIKSFNEAYDANKRRRVSALEEEVNYYTNEAHAIKRAKENLDNIYAEEKIAIIIADGGSNDPAETREAITAFNQSNYKLIGIGIGQGTADMKKFYKNCKANISVSNLANTLGELLKKVIIQHHI